MKKIVLETVVIIRMSRKLMDLCRISRLLLIVRTIRCCFVTYFHVVMVLFVGIGLFMEPLYTCIYLKYVSRAFFLLIDEDKLAYSTDCFNILPNLLRVK